MVMLPIGAKDAGDAETADALSLYDIKNFA